MRYRTFLNSTLGMAAVIAAGLGKHLDDFRITRLGSSRPQTNRNSRRGIPNHRKKGPGRAHWSGPRRHSPESFGCDLPPEDRFLKGYMHAHEARRFIASQADPAPWHAHRYP